MVDEKRLLNKLMKVSDEESDLLEWCFFTLNESEIASCLNDAKVIAAAEIRADNASVLLTGLFVKIIIRCLRWTRLERQREGSKTTAKKTKAKKKSPPPKLSSLLAVKKFIAGSFEPPSST